MTEEKIIEFKVIYNKFKQSKQYQGRVEQFAIVAVIRDIIYYTLQKQTFLNSDVTGFIQMFKYGCSNETFDKYLKQNIENEEILNQLSERAYEVDQWGYTGAGLNAIDSLTEDQLNQIKTFLLSAFKCETEEDAVIVCNEFENKQIPLFKQGVYSPLLYYINPYLFPIINNSHNEFRQWAGIGGSYSNCIREFNLLKTYVNETDLGLIDRITHSFTQFRNVVSKDKKIILSSEKLYKMSHGVFVKSTKYRDTGIKGVLEQNKWISLNIYTGKGQAQAFKDSLKIGDYVYVCYGGDEVYCIAKVTGELTPFDEDIDALIEGEDEWVYRTVEPLFFAENKSVHELKDDTRFFMPSGNSTFYEVPLDALSYLNEKIFKPKFNVEIVQTNSIIKSNMNIPLNTILYGPPGTGKTYHTITKAAEIIEGKSFVNRYQEAKTLYQQKLAEEQIEFVTFHQNYSYEDFVAGLRPNTTDTNQLSFKEHKGIFYRICEKAKTNWLLYTSGQTYVEPSFEEVLDIFLQPLIEEEEIELSTFATNTKFHITANNIVNLSFRKTSGGTGHTLSITTLKDYYENKRPLNQQGLSIYYNPIVEKLKKIASESRKETGKVNLQKYVLIIDEINRANISRVFGELITLLEPDKRLGEKHELTLRLPGLPDDERFGVPPNLYIVATMNTADKSIALIDIAIRRRFVFEDMYPRPEIINATVPEEYRNFLINLNTVIKDKKGVDFTIGHAYFIPDEGKQINIVQVLNQKVIPLLNEYFYNQRNNVVFNLLSSLQSHLPKIVFEQDEFIGVNAKAV